MYLSFICRPSKKLKNGTSPLEVSISVGQERMVIRLNKYLKAEDFNVKKQRVRRNEELNQFIEAVKAKFAQIETEMIKRNMPMTVRSVVDIFQNGFAETNVSLLTLFDKHNEEAKIRTDQGLISPVTYQKYLLTRRMLAAVWAGRLHTP